MVRIIRVVGGVLMLSALVVACKSTDPERDAKRPAPAFQLSLSKRGDADLSDPGAPAE